MTTYAKLIDGAPVFIERVPYISNATEEQLAEYAAANGYKPVLYLDKPGLYYDVLWNNAPKFVRRDWQAWALTDAKADAEARVQSELTATLSARVTIFCMGFEAGIVYDADALTNAAGMSVGDLYIDAANNVTALTEEQLNNIKAALKNYRMSLYAAATSKREAITAAEDVDAVEAALNAALNA